MISIRFRDVAFNILEDVSIQVTNDGDQNIITLEELEQAVKIAQIMKRDLEIRTATRTI